MSKKKPELTEALAIHWVAARREWQAAEDAWQAAAIIEDAARERLQKAVVAEREAALGCVEAPVCGTKLRRQARDEAWDEVRAEAMGVKAYNNPWVSVLAVRRNFGQQWVDAWRAAQALADRAAIRPAKLKPNTVAAAGRRM